MEDSCFRRNTITRRSASAVLLPKQEPSHSIRGVTCPIRHSRAGGNPEPSARPLPIPLDPRLRGDDEVLSTHLRAPAEAGAFDVCPRCRPREGSCFRRNTGMGLPGHAFTLKGKRHASSVIPAKEGTQGRRHGRCQFPWIPACAGMTRHEPATIVLLRKQEPSMFVLEVEPMKVPAFAGTQSSALNSPLNHRQSPEVRRCAGGGRRCGGGGRGR